MDKNWQAAFEADRQLAKIFQLDALICSSNAEFKKVGITMGSLLMMIMLQIQIEEIVDSR